MAYAAYCRYRDLGPVRSLEKAWREFAATRSTQAKRAAQRSTAWEGWSSRHGWVRRAAAHDAEMEGVRRQARIAETVRLEERRFAFEFLNQERLEKRVAKMEAVLDKADAAPITDVTQAKDETAGGKMVRTKTKVKGINFAGYASLAKALNSTAGEAITGVREKQDKGTAAAHSVKNLVFRGDPG